MGEDRERRPIALFIPSLAGGGAQRVVVNLANALSDLTDRPIHVVLVRREGPFLWDLTPNVEVIDLHGARTLFSIRSLVRYLRQERPAVTMASMNYANIVAALAHRIAGRPGRLVLREATLVAPTELASGWRSWVMVRLMRWTYRWADAVVANSVDTLHSLRNARVQCRNSAVIGNPVALPSSEAADGYREPCEAPFICAAGRLVSHKGFDILLRALAQCDSRGVHLIILGEGPLRASLEGEILRLGLRERVHMPGFINPPGAVIRNAEAFVLPSRWEGFGNVLVEALGYGVPVVATDCPGGPRDILANGEYGQLVPVDDPAALARAIDQALQNPVSTPRSRQVRAASYAPAQIAREYLDRVLRP